MPKLGREYHEAHQEPADPWGTDSDEDVPQIIQEVQPPALVLAGWLSLLLSRWLSH